MNFSHYFFSLILIALFISFSSAVSLDTSSSITIDPGIQVLEGELDGNTTDFLYLNDSQLEDIKDLRLEIYDFGKIKFIQNINLVQDSIDNIIYLGGSITISHNFISINISALSSLNNPAIITFKNLSFNNPQPYKNNVICSNCIVISNLNNELEVSVEDFNGVYTIREALESTLTEDNSGGGSSTSTNQDLIEEAFSLILSDPLNFVGYPGDEFNKTILIKNNQEKDLTVELELIGFQNYCYIDSSYYTLNSDETKSLTLKFKIPENAKEEVLIGRIKIKGQNTDLTYIVTIILNVQERTPLFNVELEVPSKDIVDLEKITTIITIVKELESIGLLEGMLSISLLDNQGNVIFSTKEGVSSLGDIVLERDFDLMEELKDGDYYFYIEFISNGEKSVMIEKVVLRRAENISPLTKLYNNIEKRIWGIISLILLLLLIILTIIICKHLHDKKNKRTKKV